MLECRADVDVCVEFLGRHGGCNESRVTSLLVSCDAMFAFQIGLNIRNFEAIPSWIIFVGRAGY